MKNNDIDKEKILSNADNADMETSVENPMETPVKTSGETSVEHMLKSARDNPPKVPASLFDAVVADAIRLNPHTNKISNTPTNTRTNTPANLNTPPIYALAGLAACLCVGFIAGIGYLNSADGAEILTALWGDDSDITTLSALINIAD